MSPSKKPQKPSKPHNAGLAFGYKWAFRDHHFTGYSLAGITTSLVYDNAGLVFDVAQGLPFNIPFKNFFITHGHSDHASGLPYVLSQRSLWSLPPANIYIPPVYVEPFKKIISLYQEMEGYTYDYNLIGFSPGDRAEINKDIVVEAFPTQHRVPSQGYLVSRRKKKMKAEFKNLSREEIIDHRRNNTPIEEMQEEGVFAFTGDTMSDFLTAFKKPVEVLFMETTFLDEIRDITAARHWGHVHLDEWVDRIETIPAEKIVIKHISARYNLAKITQILDQKIPKHLRDKIEIFPRPF